MIQQKVRPKTTNFFSFIEKFFYSQSLFFIPTDKTSEPEITATTVENNLQEPHKNHIFIIPVFKFQE